MKTLKQIFSIIVIMIFAILICNYQNSIYVTSLFNSNNRNIVKIGVSLFNFSDPYMSLVKQSLENIQNENKNSVQFTILDAKNNQSIQNENIDYFLRNHYDLLLVNLVDTKENTNYKFA